MHDLIIKNASIYQLEDGTTRPATIAIDGKTITSLDADPHAHAYRTIDVSGAYVLPGLIDLHTHFYRDVTPLGVNPWEYSYRDGVTTIVDAGSAGALTFAGLKRQLEELTPAKAYAFLNLSTIGIIHNEVGELIDLRRIDKDEMLKVITENRDHIVGIKVRLSKWVNGDDPENARAALAQALDISQQAGIPLMVHVFDPSLQLVEILDALRKGDLLTHIFSESDESVVASDENWSALLRARQRGVVFDLGCGRGGLNFNVGQEAFARGFYPDTVSSDLTKVTADGPVFGLTATMSKLLAIGMPVLEILRGVTTRPAAFLGKPELAVIAEGAEANLAIVKVIEGEFTFQQLDFLANNLTDRTSTQAFKSLATVLAGELLLANGEIKLDA